MELKDYVNEKLIDLNHKRFEGTPLHQFYCRGMYDGILELYHYIEDNKI